MSTRNDAWLYKSAAALLAMTALAKVYSAGGSAAILRIQDQLLHIDNRPLILSAALLEIAVAVFLLKGRSDLRRSLVLLWLSANFIFYHLGNYLLGLHRCPCLGELADRLPLPRGMADVFLQVLVLYWFAASLESVWRLWGSHHWSQLRGGWTGGFRKASATTD